MSKKQNDIRQSCLRPDQTNDGKVVSNSSNLDYKASKKDVHRIDLHECPIK